MLPKDFYFFSVIIGKVELFLNDQILPMHILNIIICEFMQNQFSCFLTCSYSSLLAYLQFSYQI